MSEQLFVVFKNEREIHQRKLKLLFSRRNCVPSLERAVEWVTEREEQMDFERMYRVLVDSRSALDVATAHEITNKLALQIAISR